MTSSPSLTSLARQQKLGPPFSEGSALFGARSAGAFTRRVKVCFDYSRDQDLYEKLVQRCGGYKLGIHLLPSWLPTQPYLPALISLTRGPVRRKRGPLVVLTLLILCRANEQK